nr:acyl transferase [Saprospiraceae bacterium]
MTKDFHLERNEVMRSVKLLLENKCDNFNECALKVFNFQSRYNPLYVEFIELLQANLSVIDHYSKIPCMPVDFFKHRIIKAGKWNEKMVFKSSGTTGQKRSHHYVNSPKWYSEVCVNTFESIYGPMEDYQWIGLLPNYIQQKDSSLVYMVSEFINRSENSKCCGLFSGIDESFKKVLNCAVESDKKTVLIGVSFALLDLAEIRECLLTDNFIVMETGGMKGRRREMTRLELHRTLSESLGLDRIHSEYGMTEIFSQAYSEGNGLFSPGPLMRVITREINDPLSLEKMGKAGGINIIDLANYDTLPFISTMDIGVLRENNQFEVMGRLDGSEMRGCNLMYFS